MSLLLLSDDVSGGSDLAPPSPLVQQYARMMIALLPPGKLWRLIGESVLGNLFAGCAEELARLDGRVIDLLDEADPTTAEESLPEYELELGLVAAATLEERRANVVARLVRRQRFRPVDFQNALSPLLNLAAEDITVIERTAAFAASIGDAREIYRFFVVGDFGDPLAFIASAQALLDSMKPSHTAGYIIGSTTAVYDSPFSLYDRDLMGV